MTPRLILTLLMVIAAPAGAQSVGDEAAAQPLAQAALPRAEVRSIVSEVRTIDGLNGSVGSASRGISAAVVSIAGVQRSLAANGLDARLVNGALEVSLAGDVLFDFDKATLRASAFTTLERVKQAAAQTGARPVRVAGFTDAVGTTAHNKPLSEARARAVADWLAHAGIDRARITSIGYGAARPVAPNRKPDGADDPAGRQRNRRVTVTL